jgi:PhnB protein
VNYAGTCEEAFRFYEKHLGGKIAMMMRHEENPRPGLPAEYGKKILHAQIALGGTALMGADIPNAEPMRSAYVSLTVATAAEAERIYALLSEGGQVFMKMEQTFYAERFAMLRDRFGTSWMLLGHPANR